MIVTPGAEPLAHGAIPPERKELLMWQSFTTALSFLTILRLPFSPPRLSTPEELAGSFAFFPLVGLALGACCLLVAAATAAVAPAPLPALAATAALALLTRALHLDGLADLADGVWGAYAPHRRLEIMKDSRIGAFGALALVFAVLFKAASINLIIQHGPIEALLLVPVLSRTAMVFAAHKAPYARTEGGLGKPFLQHMTSRLLLTATLIACAALALFSPRLAIPFAIVAALSALILKRAIMRALGGITGDALGAVNELTELALFFTAACLPSH